MSVEKVDIENPKFKESPFELPENYFPSLRDSISERIAAESDRKRVVKSGVGIYLRPKIACVAVVSILLIVGYIALSPYMTEKPAEELASTEIDIIESGFLYSSFIDFFDEEADMSEAMIGEENITDDEIISFLSENAGIMLLASLD
jgi:hypothetical protein